MDLGLAMIGGFFSPFVVGLRFVNYSFTFALPMLFLLYGLSFISIFAFVSNSLVLTGVRGYMYGFRFIFYHFRINNGGFGVGNVVFGLLLLYCWLEGG